MGLQAGLWTEMRVSANIKQKLSVRVGTHQLQRLGILRKYRNSDIFSLVRGRYWTSGWIIG
jgi:hypothetical protein